ncbi:MAG: hypothetical protein Q9208_007226 [Pyrenodesmia sp. 3 TL-2023]
MAPVSFQVANWETSSNQDLDYRDWIVRSNSSPTAVPDEYDADSESDPQPHSNNVTPPSMDAWGEPYSVDYPHPPVPASTSSSSLSSPFVVRHFADSGDETQEHSAAEALVQRLTTITDVTEAAAEHMDDDDKQGQELTDAYLDQQNYHQRSQTEEHQPPPVRRSHDDWDFAQRVEKDGKIEMKEAKYRVGMKGFLRLLYVRITTMSHIHEEELYEQPDGQVLPSKLAPLICKLQNESSTMSSPEDPSLADFNAFGHLIEAALQDDDHFSWPMLTRLLRSFSLPDSSLQAEIQAADDENRASEHLPPRPWSEIEKEGEQEVGDVEEEIAFVLDHWGGGEDLFMKWDTEERGRRGLGPRGREEMKGELMPRVEGVLAEVIYKVDGRVRKERGLGLRPREEFDRVFEEGGVKGLLALLR